MDDYKINKVLGVVLGTALFLQAVHIIDGALTPKIAKADSEGAAKEGSRPLAGSGWTACLPAPPPNTARRSPSSVRFATTSRKAKAPRSGPTSTASSIARSLR